MEVCRCRGATQAQSQLLIALARDESALDTSHDSHRIGQRMLPNAEDDPALRAQGASDAAVARLISTKFRLPILVPPGAAIMKRAAVPETSINEDGNSGLWKREIWPPWKVRVPPPASDLFGTKDVQEAKFRGLVPERANPLHRNGRHNILDRPFHRSPRSSALNDQRLQVCCRCTRQAAEVVAAFGKRGRKRGRENILAVEFTNRRSGLPCGRGTRRRHISR